LARDEILAPENEDAYVLNIIEKKRMNQIRRGDKTRKKVEVMGLHQFRLPPALVIAWLA
jgi:hypothetical protein